MPEWLQYVGFGLVCLFIFGAVIEMGMKADKKREERER